MSGGDYTYQIKATRPLTERQLFERMVRDAISTDFPPTADNLRRITQEVLANRKEGEYLLFKGQPIDGLVPVKDVTLKGQKGPVMGYYVEIDASLRREIALAARELGIEPKPSRVKAVEQNAALEPGGGDASQTGPGKNGNPRDGWSQEYRDRTDDAQKQALDIQAKFRAMDEFYQSKNQRHGLGSYVHSYLAGAAANAAEVGRLIEEANKGTDTASKLEAINAKFGQTLNEVVGPDHRARTPAGVRKFFDDSYKAEFDTWTNFAEWVGTIPTPATRGFEFGTKVLMNSLKLYSGDINGSDMAFYTLADGAKFFTGNYGDKLSKLDGGATLKVMSDTVGNIVTNMADAHKKLAENPGMDANTVYRTALGKAFTESFTGALGDNVKLLDKYGAGPEAIKNFGLGMGKNVMGEVMEMQKQAAANPNADAGQLWKEAAARALVKTFAEGVTKSGKNALDDDAQKAIIETAGKLGLQEPVKQLLKDMQTQSTPDPNKPAPTVPAPIPQPQAAVPGGVADSDNFRSMVASAEKLKLPGDVTPFSVAVKATDVAQRENVSASAVIQGRDLEALSAVNPALNLRTSTFTVAEVRQMDVATTLAVVEQRALAEQQAAATIQSNARAQA